MKRFVPFLLILLAVTSLSSCGYNSLVEEREAVKKAWADVEVQYQRRADLIPNLVNTVKGAADFEKETLTAVIQARSQATAVNLNVDELTPENLQKFQQAQGQVSSALSRLLVSVERYPDIKANQNFRDLQLQLEGTENRIAVARKRYNESVTTYNTHIQKFPTLITASLFGFEAMHLFEAEEGTEKAPEVSFE